MPSEKAYRLTGGVFFQLISKCLQNTGKKEVDCLSALAAIFDGSQKIVSQKTKRSNTTQYKKCELDNSMHLPFGNRKLREMFRNRLEQNYNSVLAEMSEFTKEFIPQSDYSWLASAIDDILQGDSSAKTAKFRILANGNAVSYQELLDMEEVEIEPFLTGIWGFILTERPRNTEGAATIHALTSEPETKGSPWQFVGDVGILEHKKAVSMNQKATSDYHHTFISHDAKVAPELTPEGELFVLEDSEIDKVRSEYGDYFDQLRKHYDKITTLLYADTPQPFYDFYVCNDIYRVEAGRSRHVISIQNVTADKLIEHSNYVLLSGNGGVGKSMMMRHLLLDCVNRYEEVGLLPIFLELRSYAESSDSLADYAYHVFTKHSGNKDRTEFDEMLKQGDILLLCDGLDEVQSDYRNRFQQKLEEFVSAFSESVIVISSRPFGPFGSYASMRRFTVFYLRPFNMLQALELVEKLKFHEEEPKIKQNFIDALKDRLFWTHNSFAENPLLLTIMMMMYAEIGDVPSKMHLFYNEAFQVLARKHDATKGGYKRPLATKLDVEAFKEVFSEFCARTYNDEKVELTEEQMEMYCDKLKAVREGKCQWNYETFAEDLTSNLCLMYYESLKYHFVHRSFQEYFCARYLSKRLDKNLYKLALTFFESKHYRYYSDSTFSLLYDMIPERVVENVFIPYLRDLFTDCDCGDGYETFLETLYPEISYNYGEVGSTAETEARSFLYNFILRSADINFRVEDSDFPFESDFVTETYVELDEEWLEKNESSDDTIVAKDEVDLPYRIDMGEPDEVGYNLAFDTSEMLRNPDKYPEFSARLFSDSFALRKEYDAVRKYYEDLNQRHSRHQEDVFELL